MRATSLAMFTILEVYNGPSGSWQLRLNHPTFYLPCERDGAHMRLRGSETQHTHSAATGLQMHASSCHAQNEIDFMLYALKLIVVCICYDLVAQYLACMFSLDMNANSNGAFLFEMFT